MYDASIPPPDPHRDVCAGYIGGDTPHLWSDAEWASQSARWRLPIYVCDNPGSRNAISDANAAIGWMSAHAVPRGSALALDYETAVDGAYAAAFDKAVVRAGYRTLLYGSLSTVTRNPRPSAGYWAADWTGAPHLVPGTEATQYASDTMLGEPYDLSLVSDTLVLWDTRPAAPAPAPADQEDDMQQIEPTTVHPGEYAYGINSQGGAVKTVRFSCDGYGGVASLRVVTWDSNGCLVHSITVGGQGTGPGSHLVSVAFGDAATTYQVTVRRLDSGDFPVGVSIV
jgi:hypothetical protein